MKLTNADTSRIKQGQPSVAATHWLRPLRVIPLTLGLLSLTDNVLAGDFSGTVLLTSDYFWRGYSKSNGEVSFQLNAEYVAEGGLYGG
jgi:hypothetical protein